MIEQEFDQTLTVNTQLLGQATLGVGVKSLQRLSRTGQQVTVNKNLLEILIKKVTASDKRLELLQGKIDNLTQLILELTKSQDVDSDVKVLEGEGSQSAAPAAPAAAPAASATAAASAASAATPGVSQEYVPEGSTGNTPTYTPTPVGQVTYQQLLPWLMSTFQALTEAQKEEQSQQEKEKPLPQPKEKEKPPPQLQAKKRKEAPAPPGWALQCQSEDEQPAEQTKPGNQNQRDLRCKRNNYIPEQKPARLPKRQRKELKELKKFNKMQQKFAQRGFIQPQYVQYPAPQW